MSDTGVGVPPAKLDHLFDPFTQADSSTTRIYGGTGLGLAISREIVEAMGGALDYAPNPGGGSVFTFTALLDPGADDGSGDRSGSADDARARELLAGRRALVVDDNETYRLILGEQVAWWGMAADTASVGRRGDDAARGRGGVRRDPARPRRARAGRPRPGPTGARGAGARRRAHAR